MLANSKSHLQLKAGGVDAVALVLADEVQDGPLLLSRVRRLQLVEGAEVEDKGLLEEGGRVLGDLGLLKEGFLRHILAIRPT